MNLTKNLDPQKCQKCTSVHRLHNVDHIVTELTRDNGDRFESAKDTKCSQRCQVSHWKCHRYVSARSRQALNLHSYTMLCDYLLYHKCTVKLMNFTKRQNLWLGLQFIDSVSVVIDIIFVCNKRNEIAKKTALHVIRASTGENGIIRKFYLWFFRLFAFVVLFILVYAVLSSFLSAVISTDKDSCIKTQTSYARATTTKSSQFQTSLRYENSSTISPLAIILIRLSTVYSSVKIILQLKPFSRG